MFPEEVSFSLKQRLATHAAAVDKTLPTSHVSEEEGDVWQLTEDTQPLDETSCADGSWCENYAKSRRARRLRMCVPSNQILKPKKGACS